MLEVLAALELLLLRRRAPLLNFSFHSSPLRKASSKVLLQFSQQGRKGMSSGSAAKTAESIADVDAEATRLWIGAPGGGGEEDTGR